MPSLPAEHVLNTALPHPDRQLNGSLRPVRIAMVGLNYGRHILAQLLKSPSSRFFTLAAVCDRDAAKSTLVSDELGVANFTDYQEMLRSPELDAVAIFTGPAGRANLIREALRAGKHVLTTKPFEVNPEEARRVLREARERRLVLHLNSPGPTLPPDLALIREWQNIHDLGRPVAARAHVWARHREKADGSWYDDPAQCPLGPMFRIGIYLINDLVYCCGPVKRVQAMQSRLFTGRPVADNSQISLLFENGALGSIFSSFCIGDGDSYRNSFAVNFENGTVYKNYGAPRADMTLYGAELSLVKISGGKRSQIEQAAISNGSGTYQWEAFCRAVNGEALENPTDDTLIVESLKVIEAMSHAVTNGGVSDLA